MTAMKRLIGVGIITSFLASFTVAQFLPGQGVPITYICRCKLPPPNVTRADQQYYLNAATELCASFVHALMVEDGSSIRKARCPGVERMHAFLDECRNTELDDLILVGECHLSTENYHPPHLLVDHDNSVFNRGLPAICQCLLPRSVRYEGGSFTYSVCPKVRGNYLRRTERCALLSKYLVVRFMRECLNRQFILRSGQHLRANCACRDV